MDHLDTNTNLSEGVHIDGQKGHNNEAEGQRERGSGQTTAKETQKNREKNNFDEIICSNDEFIFVTLENEFKSATVTVETARRGVQEASLNVKEGDEAVRKAHEQAGMFKLRKAQALERLKTAEENLAQARKAKEEANKKARGKVATTATQTTSTMTSTQTGPQRKEAEEANAWTPEAARARAAEARENAEANSRRPARMPGGVRRPEVSRDSTFFPPRKGPGINQAIMERECVRQLSTYGMWHPRLAPGGRGAVRISPAAARFLLEAIEEGCKGGKDAYTRVRDALRVVAKRTPGAKQLPPAPWMIPKQEEKPREANKEESGQQEEPVATVTAEVLQDDGKTMNVDTEPGPDEGGTSRAGSAADDPLTARKRTARERTPAVTQGGDPPGGSPPATHPSKKRMVASPKPSTGKEVQGNTGQRAASAESPDADENVITNANTPAANPGVRA